MLHNINSSGAISGDKASSSQPGSSLLPSYTTANESAVGTQPSQEKQGQSGFSAVFSEQQNKSPVQQKTHAASKATASDDDKHSELRQHAESDLDKLAVADGHVDADIHAHADAHTKEHADSKLSEQSKAGNSELPLTAHNTSLSGLGEAIRQALGDEISDQGAVSKSEFLENLQQRQKSDTNGELAGLFATSSVVGENLGHGDSSEDGKGSEHTTKFAVDGIPLDIVSESLKVEQVDFFGLMQSMQNSEAKPSTPSTLDGQDPVLSSATLDQQSVKVDISNPDHVELLAVDKVVFDQSVLMDVSSELVNKGDTSSVKVALSEPQPVKGGTDAIKFTARANDSTVGAEQALSLAEAQQVVSQWNQEFIESAPRERQQMLQQLQQLASDVSNKSLPNGSAHNTNANKANQSSVNVGNLPESLQWSESEQKLALDGLTEDGAIKSGLKGELPLDTPKLAVTSSQLLSTLDRSLRVTSLAGIDGQAGYSLASGIDASSGMMDIAAMELSTNQHSNKPVAEKMLPTLDLMRANAPQKMAEAVSVMLNQRQLSADIRLDPADLGMMQVRITMQGDQAHVNFIVQSQQTQSIIEQTTQRLREILHSQGIELGDTSVSRDDQQFADQQQGEPQSTADGQPATADGSDADPETTQVSVAIVDDGRIDDFA